MGALGMCCNGKRTQNYGTITNICDNMDAMDISSGQWWYGVLRHFVG